MGAAIGRGYWAGRCAAIVAACVCLSGAISDLAHARGGNGFERQTRGGVTTLSYAFTDFAGQNQRLSFDVPSSVITRAERNFRQIDNTSLSTRQRTAYLDMLGVELRKIERAYPGVDIQVGRDGQISWSTPRSSAAPGLAFQRALDADITRLSRDFPHLDIRVIYEGGEPALEVRGRLSARDEAVLEPRIDAAFSRAEAAERAARDAAAEKPDPMAGVRAKIEAAIAAAEANAEGAFGSELRAQGYRLESGTTALPDYARFARKGAKDLQGGDQAFKTLVRGVDRRTGLNRILAFFQAIPYDTLESRTSFSDGAGFVHPVAMLANNRGDCDTKSVAFASVLHRLWPDLEIAMVLLDEHALIALNIRPARGERAIRHRGQQWVLAEPVGPGYAPLGAISPLSQRGIRSGPQVLRLF